LKISITGIAPSESSTIYVAVAEDGLASQVTGGENGGANLRHTSVVRVLKAAGTIEKGQSSSAIETDIPTDPAWKSEKLHYVVFVQETGSRAVIAVASISP